LRTDPHIACLASRWPDNPSTPSEGQPGALPDQRNSALE
jgi:hypothetical protein